MSAYGAISLPLSRPTQPLETRSYPFGKKPGFTVLVLHVTRQSAPTELIGLLHEEFAQELEAGQTYPQEGPMDRATFEGYFFAADVFVGMAVTNEEVGVLAHKSIEDVRAGRSWDESVVGQVFLSRDSLWIIETDLYRSTYLKDPTMLNPTTQAVLPISATPGSSYALAFVA
ncbi:hypothetical protein FRC12_010595 [Ceratobasidium sp. 428]|nr:hypothetical protein FRC12_010595 [Ceratobasidium sp. 428]